MDAVSVLWMVGLTIGLLIIAIPLVNFSFFTAIYLSLLLMDKRKLKEERSHLKSLIKQNGFIKAEAVDWISRIVLRNQRLNKSKLAFKIRSFGDEISADEKTFLKVHLNTKIGDKYFDALTVKGQREPLKGAENIALHLLNLNQGQNNLEYASN